MISIIIPTFNEEKYLPLLLESLKKQSFRDFEVIVADNNSKDKTREIARGYGCKVVSGGLPGKGRNEGAKAAKNDLLLFLDADLILSQEFIEKLLKEFKEKNLDIASTDLDFLTDGKKYKIAAKICNFYYKQTEKLLPCIAECILVKKNLHQTIGGFDERIKLLEDFVYVRRAAKIGKFSHLTSGKFYVSTRRFETDGFLKTLIKYFLANFYMIFFGPIKSNIFNYKFGHYSSREKN